MYGNACAGNNRKVHAIQSKATHPDWSEYITLCGIRIPARPQSTQKTLPKCKRCF